MFSQRDPKWSEKQLGKSGLNMANYGCTVTAIAQALNFSGYNVNPGDVCDSLNNNSGFLDDGRLIWAKVGEAYPQFHFAGDGYKFVKGIWGKFQHWVLEINGKQYDPFYGNENAPSGFYEVSGSRTASIDAPTPQTPPESPQTTPSRRFDINLTPGLINNDEVRLLQIRLKELGFFPADIDITGNYKSITKNAVFELQKKFGIVSSPTDYGAGYFGPRTREVINTL